MKQILTLIDTRQALYGLSLATALLLASPASAEDIYKWVSDDNQVHYTQMPPPHGIKAIRIQRADVPNQDDDEPTDEAETLEDTGQAAVDDYAGQAPADEGPADVDAAGAEDEDVKLAKALQKNCNNARKNLQTLNRGQVRYVDPEGKIIRLSEEERQDRIAEARAQIGVLCKE